MTLKRQRQRLGTNTIEGKAGPTRHRHTNKFLVWDATRSVGVGACPVACRNCRLIQPSLRLKPHDACAALSNLDSFSNARPRSDTTAMDVKRAFGKDITPAKPHYAMASPQGLPLQTCGMVLQPSAVTVTAVSAVQARCASVLAFVPYCNVALPPRLSGFVFVPGVLLPGVLPAMMELRRRLTAVQTAARRSSFVTPYFAPGTVPSLPVVTPVHCPDGDREAYA